MLHELEPPPKYEFVKTLPATQEAIRTKETVLECKVSHVRTPLTWYFNKKEINVSTMNFYCFLLLWMKFTVVKRLDPRFLVEKDAMGRCTLTIKVTEKEDEGEWTAKITDELFCVCNMYVEGETQLERKEKWFLLTFSNCFPHFAL